MSDINLPWLDPNNQDAPFPPAESALKDPEGLVAAGGDLEPTRLLRAYHQGLFPWYEEGQPILWWSPNPRGILYPKDFIAHKSLIRKIKNNSWRISYNKAFLEVMKACAEPRNNSRSTWITQDMIQAYVKLYEIKQAHSLEVWDEENNLIGGVYGISIGTIFFGESMFSRMTDASKVALLYLSAYLDTWGYKVIDTQLPSPHLSSIGGSKMSRNNYLSLLSELTPKSCSRNAWLAEPEIDILGWIKHH
ncbi:MAG: leucyl/phenylalanyl-tRNA--protein transferase [Gammaproteobacteria bacterium]|nr:leucyl/phenylalanyl-tRNA--protein transferase [Gammaproteobacteria bacterium]